MIFMSASFESSRVRVYIGTTDTYLETRQGTNGPLYTAATRTDEYQLELVTMYYSTVPFLFHNGFLSARPWKKDWTPPITVAQSRSFLRIWVSFGWIHTFLESIQVLGYLHLSTALLVLLAATELGGEV